MMKKLIILILNLSFLIYTGLIGFTYLLKTNGYSELTSHFALLFFIISLMYFGFYIFCQNRIFMVLSLITLGVTAYQWIPLLLPQSVDATLHQEEVSFLQLNIWCHMDDVTQVLNCVKAKGYPDIVVIEEATPEIADKLRPLKANYPHIFDATEHGAFGMILFSKIPLYNVQRKQMRESFNKYTVAELKTPENHIPFTLIEFHAFSPAGDISMNIRKGELEEIAQVILQASHKHKILIGDLNTTAFSPYFKKLLEESRLHNSMTGKRIQGTWPNWLPSFLRLPIDHLLISDGMYVDTQEICSHVGSDHMPIFTRIKMVS